MFHMLYADVVNAVQSPSDKILTSMSFFEGFFSFVGFFGFLFYFKALYKSTHLQAHPLSKAKT